MLIEFPKEIRKGTLSNPKKDSKYIKARLQKIIIKNEEVLQLSLYTNKQVFHENILTKMMLIQN